jgi:hypothetical protein
MTQPQKARVFVPDILFKNDTMFASRALFKERFFPNFLANIIISFQVSISPTFYEQLLRQNPFAKKLQTQNSKHLKAMQRTLV